MPEARSRFQPRDPAVAALIREAWVKLLEMKRILGARTNLKCLSRKPALDFAGLRVPLRSSARLFYVSHGRSRRSGTRETHYGRVTDDPPLLPLLQNGSP